MLQIYIMISLLSENFTSYSLLIALAAMIQMVVLAKL